LWIDKFCQHQKRHLAEHSAYQAKKYVSTWQAAVRKYVSTWQAAAKKYVSTSQTAAKKCEYLTGNKDLHDAGG
jgi:hypothetical protein